MPESIECFICGDHRPNSLEEHHIVPQRYNGSDEPENLVQLCSSCHAAIEKLYDDSFYQRLGVEAIEDSKITDIDTEGTKLQPRETKDRDFPTDPVHISKEKFCLNITFSQFMIYPTRDLISDHYPESDVLIRRIKEDTDEITEHFRSFRKPSSYTISPDDTRRTPIVQIVPTKDLSDFTSPSEQTKENAELGLVSTSPSSQKRDYAADINESGLLTGDFKRLHCGYCHTVYSGDEQADLAAHLRIKHRVEEPYLDERDIQDDLNLLRRSE